MNYWRQGLNNLKPATGNKEKATEPQVDNNTQDNK